MALTELPKYTSYGMSVEQFAEAQQQFTEYARTRIIIGGQEYDLGESQRIENLTPVQIVKELRDEIADAVNYLVGLDIAIARIVERLDNA